MFSEDPSMLSEGVKMTPANMAIEARDISKSFQIYDRPQDRLLQGLFRGRRTFYREFWALRGVSFDVARGETVGVIGRNGSGKSTLLQIICGTLTPTSGTVRVDGRISALLELGAGFNLDFSGRENVYMNAALMGLSLTQIEERFDEIAAFADIGQFIDQSVKTYSSGMYVRLAFAVAANVSPDILVIDEALAVGDMAFQAKCMSRIRFMMESGVTVLFVSHDIGAVKALCSRCLYLNEGRVVEWGQTESAAGRYIRDSHTEMNRALGTVEHAAEKPRLLSDPTGESRSVREASRFAVRTDTCAQLSAQVRRYGDGRVTILDIKLLDALAEPVCDLELDAPFEIQIAVRINEDLPDVAWGYSMRDLKGQMLVGMMSTADEAIGPQAVKAGDTLVLSIKGVNALQPGVYTVSVGIELPVTINREHIFLEVVENSLVFRSLPPTDPRKLCPGLVRTPVAFEMLAKMDGSPIGE